MTSINVNVFDSIDYLEPRCPKCNVKIDYGINTEYSDAHNAHVCNNCGMIIR